MWNSKEKQESGENSKVGTVLCSHYKFIVLWVGGGTEWVRVGVCVYNICWVMKSPPHFPVATTYCRLAALLCWSYHSTGTSEFKTRFLSWLLARAILQWRRRGWLVNGAGYARDTCGHVAALCGCLSVCLSVEWMMIQCGGDEFNLDDDISGSDRTVECSAWKGGVFNVQCVNK